MNIGEGFQGHTHEGDCISEATTLTGVCVCACLPFCMLTALSFGMVSAGNSPVK